MTAIRLLPGDLDDPRVLDLLAFHLAGMRADSPPEASYALDVSGLRVPEVTFLTAWSEDDLLGCGALKALGDGTAEVKSMRTWPQHLRKGVGRAILTEIIAIARARGYHRLSLETGTGPSFEAAIALYRRQGFENGPVFNAYRESDFNQFLHLDL